MLHLTVVSNCRAELEAKLASMESKLLQGEQAGGLAAVAQKQQEALAARQRELQEQKNRVCIINLCLLS